MVVSSLLFAGASLMTTMPSNPVFLRSVFFVDSVGMAFISALSGYLVMVMFMSESVSFHPLFSVYALSSGVTLLASWVPFLSCLLSNGNGGLPGRECYTVLGSDAHKFC